jgi:transposase
VGATPVDRGKPGSKLHLVCEGGGLPLTVVVTAANVADTIMFAALLDDLAAIGTSSGRRRALPAGVPRTRAMTARPTGPGCGGARFGRGLPRRGIQSSARLGRQRWNVERALSWRSCWRRLQVRRDRDSGRFFAFVLVACALVCFNRLEVAPS